MTKCIGCKSKIVKLKIKKEEGKEEEIWFHPFTEKECNYKDEGIQINVIDPLIQKKFKELMSEKENWFDKIIWKEM